MKVLRWHLKDFIKGNNSVLNNEIGLPYMYFIYTDMFVYTHK